MCVYVYAYIHLCCYVRKRDSEALEHAAISDVMANGHAIVSIVDNEIQNDAYI